MQTLAATCIAADPDCFVLHPGDIPHRLFNGMRYEHPTDFVTLWEDASGLVAWTAVYASRWRSFDALVIVERRSQLERSVIEHAEEHLLAEMARLGEEGETIEASADRCDAVRGPILEELGWEPKGHDFTLARRSLDHVPDTALPEGFVVRAVRGVEEAAAVADVHAGSFGSTWDPELYRRVMESPGYEAEREFVVEAPDGRLAAFTVTWHDHDNRLGLFELVGTHEDFRRIGLGRAVMVAGMRSMRAAGMERAIVSYEVTNPPSAALYASLGFEPLIESVAYTKRVGRDAG
jgi:ribosomal protein S18 acetylase RimI-like enzyme